jgi:hypothetical protein
MTKRPANFATFRSARYLSFSTKAAEDFGLRVDQEYLYSVDLGRRKLILTLLENPNPWDNTLRMIESGNINKQGIQIPKIVKTSLFEGLGMTTRTVRVPIELVSDKPLTLEIDLPIEKKPERVYPSQINRKVRP